MYQYSYFTPLKAIRNSFINKVILHLGIDLSEAYRAQPARISGTVTTVASLISCAISRDEGGNAWQSLRSLAVDILRDTPLR